MSTRRAGFTLVELLVVIAVIGVLVAILLPAVQMAREAARRATCQNNLHQIGLAIHQYHETHRKLPSGWISEQPEGEPGWGWACLILPYMEGDNLHDLIDFDVHIDDPANEHSRVFGISNYFCPSDNARTTFLLEDDPDQDDPHEHDHLPIRIATSNYVGVVGGCRIQSPG